MRETRLTFPELGLIALTRVVGGIGLGLLLSDQLPSGERRALGWGLAAIGLITTIPLAVQVFGKSSTPFEPSEQVERDLIAAGA